MKVTAQSITDTFKNLNAQLSEYERDLCDIERMCETKFHMLTASFDKDDFNCLCNTTHQLTSDIKMMKQIPICSNTLIEYLNNIIDKNNNYIREIKLIEKRKRLKPLLMQWRDKATGDKVYRKLKDYRIDESCYDEVLHCYHIFHNDTLVKTTRKTNKFGKSEYFITINGHEFQVKKIIAQHFDIPNDDVEKTCLYYKKDLNNNRFGNLEYDYPERWLHKQRNN